MAGFGTVQTLFKDPTTQFDSLEAILEKPLNIAGKWDTDYGHVTRGHMVKVVTKTVNGITEEFVRPILVGKVKAVSGAIVTLEAGAAAGQGLIGKTLNKVTAAGVVSALTTTVSAVVDTEGALESRTLYDVRITFSGAGHGLVAGDFVGCEGLTGTEAALGIIHESHNNDNGGAAVSFRAIYWTGKLIGNTALFQKWIANAKVYQNTLFFQTY